jgi:hypothetical protein
MNAVSEAVVLGILVPATVSFSVALLCHRILPRTVARRWMLPAALSVGFAIGYVVLPEWAEIVPARHWQWIPYLGVATALAGAVGRARGIWFPERWLIHGLVAAAAALLLVPDWPELDPPRVQLVPIVAGWLFLLFMALPPLAERIASVWLLAHLCAAAVVTALAIAAFVSLKYAQLAGLAAASLVGCSAAALFLRQHAEPRSVMPVFAVLVGGSAFTGYIDPQPPLTGLLLLPAAPLALWLTVMLPGSKSPGAIGYFAQLAATAVALAAGIGVAWLASS